MTFTYTEDLTDDADFVRFHTGDTDSDGYFLSDEIITSLLATETSKQNAVLSGLTYIITQLAQPNFKADWLQVDNSTALATYRTLLAEKRAAFGSRRVTGSAVHVYRADSQQTEAIDYSEGV